jgi:hypothetical protein
MTILNGRKSGIETQAQKKATAVIEPEKPAKKTRAKDKKAKS